MAPPIAAARSYHYAGGEAGTPLGLDQGLRFNGILSLGLRLTLWLLQQGQRALEAAIAEYRTAALSACP